MKRALDSLLETDSKIGMAILDPKMRVLFVNEKMKRLYPVNQGEFYPPNTHLQQIIALSLQEGKSIDGFPIHETIDGKELHTLLYTQPHRENERFASLVVIVCDITSLYTTFQSQVHQEKLKTIGDMAAGTADVILNPFGVIKGTLQLIEQSIKKDVVSIDLTTHPLNQKLEQYFTLSNEQIEHVDHLLQRFLLLGKPSKTTFAPVSIISFLQELIPHIQNIALEHNITLICEYPSCHGQVLAHKDYLEEALYALFQNAFEATRKGGVVKIRTEVTKDTIHFIISDQGEGISEDMIQHVKEPFFTTKNQALGFGLSFCEGIIQKMEGTLDIQSSSKGTQVHVVLPKIR